MSTGWVIAIAVPVLVVLALVVAVVSLRRADVKGLGRLSRETRQRDESSTARAASEAAASAPRAGAFGASAEATALERSVAAGETAVALAPEPGEAEPWSPPDAEEVGVTRRQFLNRASITLMVVGLNAFGVANIAFLWPRPTGGFGSKVKVGSIDAVNDAISATTPAVNFSYFSVAQSYIQPFPTDAATQANAEGVYSGAVLEGMKQGYVALWQKCPHLGCKVPVCGTSQWFECPCHGSQYNRVGEKKAGPAPRGMDRFPVLFEGNNVVIDTRRAVQGPPIGTDTTGQGLEGPHCVT